MAGLNHYLILSAILFSIGLFGALTKRNIITILMAVELMFNAVNLALIAFARFSAPALLTGHVFALFIITVAAAEVALGLGLIIAIYRNRETVDITDIAEMKG